MGKSIKISRKYNHSKDKVWSSITTKEALSTWLMPCDLVLEEGNKFTFQTKPYPGFDGVVHCTVLQIEPKSLFSFTWSGGNLQDTIVKFNLKESSDGSTLLEFEHSGFEGFFNNLIAKTILSRGWRNTLLRINLTKYLDQ